MLSTEWLDRTEYPFDLNYFPLSEGRMHYVDAGHGSPVVMVHGTPSWSFLYRHLITGLSSGYRCIAPDHLGFGLSDKPPHLDYHPADLAANLRTLIEHLDLRDITLVVHDFGGPIGLSYAIEQPENVRALVLFNTWMWSRADEPAIKWPVKFFSTPLGKWLYMNQNISPRLLLKAALGKQYRLTKHVHRQYIKPFPHTADRRALWMFARQMVGASDWYERLWQQRDRLATKPALLLWGMQDPFFKEDALSRWQSVLPNAQTHTFPRAGHFVAEEQGRSLVPTVNQFLQQAGVPQSGNSSSISTNALR